MACRTAPEEGPQDLGELKDMFAPPSFQMGEQPLPCPLVPLPLPQRPFVYLWSRYLYGGVIHPSREILATSMNGPVRLNGALARTFCPPMWSPRSELPWYTYEVSFRKLSSFKVLVAPIRTRSPAGDSLERAEALDRE